MQRNVWFLTSEELRKYPIAGALTALFFALTGLMLGGIVLSGRNAGEDTDALTKLIIHANTDWVLMCLIITLAFVFTKDYFSYQRTDVFSRRLAFYRKLPIRNRDILLSRYLLMVLSLAAMSVCFYVPLYLMLRTEQAVGPMAFLGAALVWTGVSLLAGVGYIHLELGYPGRRYMKMNFILVFLLLIVVIVLSVRGVRIAEGTFGLAERHGFYPGLVSILLAAGGMYGMFRVTLRRISTRDLL